MAAAKPEYRSSDIPEQVFDANTNKTYKLMRFFGKGSFGKCYEIIDVATNAVFAGKIVSKKLIVSETQKVKMQQEVLIHLNLRHENIVKFHGYFEDSLNVYIVLELCRQCSLLELQKRRKTVTEYECRYFMQQIVRGVEYLHKNHIIHRDLKLANLLLNDMLHVKIGDFGLATRVDYEGERKQTVCGTPNYIAPEILARKGHSYEVDIWSIGCVMYTLLVGQPPFERNTLNDTYAQINKCEYRVPHFMSKPAAEMIAAMLQLNPLKRPKINALLNFEFLRGSVPEFLPSSCLTMAPRHVDANEKTDVEALRRVLMEMNLNGTESGSTKHKLLDTITASSPVRAPTVDYLADIRNLQTQLEELINRKPKVLEGNFRDDYTDPSAKPLFWVSKWVDYSNKYGFGYAICDQVIGVMFNDATNLIMLPNHVNVHFIDQHGKETYMTTTDYCKKLDKKMQLLDYFKNYMTEYLFKAGADHVKIVTDQISRMPYVHAWFRTKCAIVMLLTNGTVQFNFSDHNKIILCPRMKAVTYMDQDNKFYTFRFSTLTQIGCAHDLYQKIRYVQGKLPKILEKLSKCSDVAIDTNH